MKTARGAGVVFGDTLKESESPGVDVLRTLKEARGAVDEGRLQGPGSRGPKVEGERGEPNEAATSAHRQHAEGSHDSMRGRRSGGNGGQAAGGAIRVDL